MTPPSTGVTPERLWTIVKRLGLAVQLTCLVAGTLLWLASLPAHASIVWSAGTFTGLAILLIEIAGNILRGNFALDIIAAVAMAGALVLGESLAGIIIATMYLGGQMLEDLAHGRVRREMNALLERAPRNASRFTDGHVERVDVGVIQPGDRLLVSRGEIVPVDGTLLSTAAVLDQSSLTGEALPARLSSGGLLLSGVTNAADAFEMCATRTSADSTYSGVVKLVESAQSSKSPAMRLADRYAVVFLILTALACGAAWLISGDPVRALAVLVVATPCPLILAVPIAILSGVSRSARRGVLIKGGEALERLAEANTLLLDKTGTLTDGRARLVEIRTFDAFEPSLVLGMAASLDQGSRHVTAEAIVMAARERGLAVKTPERSVEDPGSGIEGSIEGRRVCLGGADFIRARGGDPGRIGQLEMLSQTRGTDLVTVMIDGHVAGGLLMADRIRVETPTVLRRIRDAGISRVVLLTGDHAERARSVAATLGIDTFRSELKPKDKIAAVEEERKNGGVIMVGDGVNDAPALAAADVGVAMGARGAAASAEAAGVVLLVDRLDRLVTARQIAKRSVAIARQSAVAGILLSAVAMAAAMAGQLSPVGGAVLQELIDVAVILNALRALGEPLHIFRRPALTAKELAGLEEEHRQMRDVIDGILDLADKIPDLADEDLRRRLHELDALLSTRLLEHEKHDEDELFPRLRTKPGRELLFTGPSRTHMEIRRRLYQFKAVVEALPADSGAIERRDIQRLLDGLAAIAVLHFEEEEEVYRLLETG